MSRPCGQTVPPWRRRGRDCAEDRDASPLDPRRVVDAERELLRGVSRVHGGRVVNGNACIDPGEQAGRGQEKLLPRHRLHLSSSRDVGISAQRGARGICVFFTPG